MRPFNALSRYDRDHNDRGPHLYNVSNSKPLLKSGFNPNADMDRIKCEGPGNDDLLKHVSGTVIVSNGNGRSGRSQTDDMYLDSYAIG